MVRMYVGPYAWNALQFRIRKDTKIVDLIQFYYFIIKILLELQSKRKKTIYLSMIVLKPMLGLVPGTLSGAVDSGRITCRFQRLLDASQTSNRRRRQSSDQTASNDLFSLDSAEYYILMAKGEAVGGQLHNRAVNSDGH